LTTAQASCAPPWTVERQAVCFVAPEKIKEWCKNAGLAVIDYQRQTPEHYMVLAQRLP
jgi:hypothetical protein